MSEIENYWKTIKGFLKKTNEQICNSLQNPAKETDINKLEKILKLNLPDVFKESLLIHNGQNDNDYIITFMDYQNLLSANKMIENYKMICKLFGENDFSVIKQKNCKYIKRNYIYNHKWLKFSESDSDGLIIDFDPAKKGTVGQIFFRPHDDNPIDKIIAKSYKEWLDKLCTKIENTEYEIIDDEIVFNDFTFYE